ncbi:MAG: PAS domain S-box protein [Promethearchaeota archaeon]
MSNKVKELSESLKMSEERLKNVVETIEEGYFEVDLKGYFTYFNDSICKYTGYSEDELLYMHYSQLYDEVNRNKVFNIFNKLFRAKEGFELFEYEIIQKSGNKLYVETSIYLRYDFNGEIIGFKGLVRNITKRIKAEQNLKKSEEKCQNLIETCPMGLFEIDLNKGEMNYINPRVLEIIGYPIEELKNEKVFYNVFYSKKSLDIKKLPKNKDIEFRIRNKEGKIIWLSGKVLHIYEKEGKINTLRLWLQDITERKEMEDMKSNLLIRFSHEFKTPLISIKGFVDLLLSDMNKKLDTQTVSFLKRIKEGADKLKFLIDDFIESARLNIHLVELKLEQMNLSNLIKKCIIEMEGLIKLRKHTINLSIQNNLIVNIDSVKIFNVFVNLLENAIKFTPKEGKITIQSKLKKNTIIISIKDNGIGLRKEEIKQLFRPFGKIEKYGNGYDIISDGIGLGLYFSKEIIDLHKGKIWVESKGENKGSTFYFSLPIMENSEDNLELLKN